MSDQLQPRRRIGLLGGTFDPIHLGHLIIASEIFHRMKLDEIRFIVAPRPPHKNGIQASDDDRISMVNAAIAADPRFVIDLIEFERMGPSYTIDTLRSFRARAPHDDIFFIMGEDSLRDFPTWDAPEGIVEISRIAVATRPGVSVDLESIFRTIPTARGRISIVATPEVAISSTAIRKRLHEGVPITYLVPSPVEQHIAQHRLYME
jgi:nicotinate-nucleotide adenylyltransferase